MIAPPRRPSFDPTPGMTLGDVITELGAEAFRQELFARRVLGVSDCEPRRLHGSSPRSITRASCWRRWRRIGPRTERSSGAGSRAGERP